MDVADPDVAALLKLLPARFVGAAEKAFDFPSLRYRFVPTSMTTAPGLMKSRVTMAARPIAATTISASFVIAAMSRSWNGRS
jgi:hypothetical protein